jgi:Fe-S cluster biogenesis protein NfuA
MPELKDIEYPETGEPGAAGATEAGVGAAGFDEEALRGRVEEALDTIRPAIAMDGGNVELLDIEGGVVTLRMMGACGGCPMSTMTLKQGIEQRLREMVPGITRVDAI